jgi:hypothetical protein
VTPGPRQRNREAERLQQALDVMRPACFRLSGGGSLWGTGFFIGPYLALTAWHNVSAALYAQLDAWLGEVQLGFAVTPPTLSNPRTCGPMPKPWRRPSPEPTAPGRRRNPNQRVAT